MKRFIFSLAMIVCVAGLTSSSRAQEKGQVFVTTEWLAAHINDPSVIVLNVAQNRRDYEKGHIPGARFLWTGWMAMSNPELSFELVPPDQLTSAVERLGISNTSRIILCSVGGNVSPTARIFATFEYLCLGTNTSILDGGFEAWKDEGRDVSKETPAVKHSKFTPHLKKDAIVDAGYVKSKLKTPGVTIIDARAPQFYYGAGGGYPRTGPIPGATNIYFSTLFDSTNKMLPVEKLRQMFSDAGVKEGDDVITYCHVGQTASAVYVTARSLGYNAHLYDGSFEDWSGRDELPVELPPPADSTKK